MDVHIAVRPCWVSTEDTHCKDSICSVRFCPFKEFAAIKNPR